VVLTQRAVLSSLPPHMAQVVCLDDPELWALSTAPHGNGTSGVAPHNLAYVLFTSGSSGRSKGVMVEYRQVSNFFAGMDDVVAFESPGTWLVVKSYRRQRIVDVKHRVVFGTLEAVAQVLSACGRQINTALVERLNLDIRQRVAAVGRRVNTLCKGEDGLQHQLAVFQSYHNFCRPHASLHQPLLIPEPTKGSGSAKRWRPCTPAMAAGLTEHVWSLKEVMLLRVPP